MSLAKMTLKYSLRIVIHLIFWIGVLLFYTYFFGFRSNDLSYVSSFSMFLMPITIALTYLFIYKLIPQYLLQQQYFKFIRYSVYSLIISAYLLGYSIFYGLIYLSNFEADNMAPISKSLIFVMVGVYMVVILVSSFKLLQLYYKGTVENSQLQTKILEAQIQLKEQELSHLKMQIHPHFLFNTLNTMYGFALKKADETPEMILKLSNLLDYVLYQIDKPKVLLSAELDHIQDYIDLENLRFHDTLDVQVNIGHYPTHLAIAPMLLLPFVENSFKHGQIVDGQLSIEINLSYHQKKLTFNVKNSISEVPKKGSGLGLDNLKRRLEMLFPGNHQLILKHDKRLFEAELQLINIT